MTPFSQNWYKHTQIESERETETERMGRKPCCCDKGVKRGAWSDTEDEILLNYIKVHGEGKWSDVPRLAGVYIWFRISFYYYNVSKLS